MKIVKIIGIVLGALVAVVGGFFGWFYMTKVRAPESQVVCDKMTSLMKEGMGAEMPSGKLAEELVAKQIDAHEKDCVSRSDRDRNFDAVKYATGAKCVMAAATYREMLACGEKEKKR